jgi:hypothetical protein
MPPFLLALWLAGAPAAPSAGILLDDAARGVTISYRRAGERIELSGDMPAGWTFSVGVDGDRDGRWGYGAEREDLHRKTSSPDWSYGQDSRGGVFCAQYILTSNPADPAQVYASTDCDGYPSQGHVEMTQLDKRGWARITYSLPAAELFGGRADVHLQICLWDSKRLACAHSPARPLVLADPGALAPALEGPGPARSGNPIP